MFTVLYDRKLGIQLIRVNSVIHVNRSIFPILGHFKIKIQICLIYVLVISVYMKAKGAKIIKY